MAHLSGHLLSLITRSELIVGVVIFLVTFVLSLAVISFILVRLPPNYFQESHPRQLWTDGPPIARCAALVAKNLLGVLLLVLGIVMSIPGVPGQGILTILLGVMLLDFPGKRRLEYKLVSRPRVLETINRLRLKFSKPPLVLD